MAKSIEEKVEDQAKEQLKTLKVHYFTKTESINSEIDAALNAAPSKSGGKGPNYPDIKVLLTMPDMSMLPVMIEAKGKMADFIKLDGGGDIVLVTTYDKDTATHKAGDQNYSAVNRYAVNGAVHYVRAVLENSSYKAGIAVGIAGEYGADGKTIVTKIGVYYIAKKNQYIPKEISGCSDLSFLEKAELSNLADKISKLDLTIEDIERLTKKTEAELDAKLRQINQVMQDTLQINVNYRVNLITGMIMAALGVPDKIAPLTLSDLKGEKGRKTHDGCVIINKISSFLDEKKLPEEKKTMLTDLLGQVFIHEKLWVPVNGESKLKSIFREIERDIMPIFRSSYHLDFSGKLFNVLNEWVTVPDGDKNDVVLTPRYVTDLMARLAEVDMNSYVWDYATGSAGFLVSAMKLMLQDARNRIANKEELCEKELHIKTKQLLGIEKLSDIYMLAVLNMILMGDGSSNILHENSLTEYTGLYEQGDNKDEPFPATVFLLNPPYSAAGKGFVFVKAALDRMTKGRAAILVQENAGSGNGLPYTKELLERHTLIASIHMSDIFCGKASVQTAIYVFDVGKKHKSKQIVKFIDFSNDGYTRQNRKKSSQDVNLRDTGDAKGRYQEVLDLVQYGSAYCKYFREGEDFIEDTISMEGDDWTFAQHKKMDLIPTEADFKKTVADYLAWRMGQIIKGGMV